MSSWQHYQNRGQEHFVEGEYTSALRSFTEAARLAQINAPRAERSNLLSKIVACRLKIGGNDNLNAALDEAKECVALNDRSSRAHLKLANVYIALGNHSNDACQSLQNAIRLDPSNSAARTLLMKELRRDHTDTDTHAGAPNSNGVDDDEDMGDYLNTSEERRSAGTSATDHVDGTSGNYTWSHWLNDKLYNLRRWYGESSDNTKALVQVSVGLLILYIAFGGRFGFENSGTSNLQGNYGIDNAYKRFYNNDFKEERRYRRRTSSASSSGETEYINSNSNQYGYNQYNNSSSYDVDYYNILIMALIVIALLGGGGGNGAQYIPIGFGMRRGLRFGRRGGGMNIRMGGFQFPIPTNRMFRRR